MRSAHASAKWMAARNLNLVAGIPLIPAPASKLIKLPAILERTTGSYSRTILAYD